MSVRLLCSSPNVSGRKRKHEDEERHSVPNILQGEVARLDVKFLVNLDPSHCSTNGTVHLICKLGERPRCTPPVAPGGAVSRPCPPQMTRTSRASRRCSSASPPTTRTRARTGRTTGTSTVRPRPGRAQLVVVVVAVADVCSSQQEPTASC